MPEREAKQAIVDLGFTVRSVYQPPADDTQRGVVISQNPAPGGRASAGSQIALTVGR
jgi:beta-lactam-binding protein with PASTA domain